MKRILSTLRDAAGRGEISPTRWRNLRERTGDIAIGTIDAFCLSLLREFPLEADLDPGFAMADETEVPHLVDDLSTARCVSVAPWACSDENVALGCRGSPSGRYHRGSGRCWTGGSSHERS